MPQRSTMRGGSNLLSRPGLHSLPADVLATVASLLDPCSLAMLCCVSRATRAAASTPALWASHSKHRWQDLNVHLFPCEPLAVRPASGVAGAHDLNAAAAAQRQAPTSEPESHEIRLARPDWHRLYRSGNGWTRPRFAVHEIHPSDSQAGFISALAVADPGWTACDAAAQGGRCSSSSSRDQEVVLLAAASAIEAWTQGGAAEDSPPVRLRQIAVPPQHLFYSLASLDGGCLAAGSSCGELQARLPCLSALRHCCVAVASNIRLQDWKMSSCR